MSEGELIRRLIVMPRPDSPEYFMLVRRVIKEMCADRLNYGISDWGNWYHKWMGSFADDS